MIREINDTESKFEQIRRDNTLVILGFKEYLAKTGLSQKTFCKHVDNVDFYVNEFLLYEKPTTPAEGVHAVGSFLGYWYIRKCAWASEHDMRKTATSLKKFYTYLCELNEITKEDLQALRQELRDELSDWVMTLKNYNDPSLSLDQVWGFEPTPGEEDEGSEHDGDLSEFPEPAGPSGAGTCFLCDTNSLSRAGATNHVKSCLKKSRTGGTNNAEHVLLKIEGHYNPEYWLYVLAPVTASLDALDEFLRDIWLECCGHLSAFSIGDQRYESQPDEDFGNCQSMDVTLKKALKNVTRFEHEYDYGSTTLLRLHVLDWHSIPQGPDEIEVLAQNNPIAKACSTCGKPAEWISPMGWGEEACYCTRCGEKTDEPEILLPLVNSPRTGVCGYTG